MDIIVPTYRMNFETLFEIKSCELFKEGYREFKWNNERKEEVNG